MMRRRRWRTRSPSTLHIHHHNGSTAMTSRCTKSFYALSIDHIDKVWEFTLIVALINTTLTIMMILLLKLSLRFLPFMVCMMLKLIVTPKKKKKQNCTSGGYYKQLHLLLSNTTIKFFDRDSSIVYIFPCKTITMISINRISTHYKL
jgi:hypothetical protein